MACLHAGGAQLKPQYEVLHALYVIHVYLFNGLGYGNELTGEYLDFK